MQRITILISLALALIASGCGRSPTVVSLSVTPASFDVTAGGPTVSLKARATYSDTSVVDVTAQATWVTSVPGQADASADGGVSAPAAARVGSSGAVSATFGGPQGSSALRVVRGPAIGPALGSDPLASQQWHLVNTGQNGFADTAGTAGADLHLSGAFALGITGKGVKVAVVDTGLEIRHPDLAANVVPGSWNFVNDTDDPTFTSGWDPDGDHGTSVSGIIGMVYDNAEGGMGIAPGVGLNGYNLLENETIVTKVKSLGGSTSNPTSNDVWIFNQSYGDTSTYPTSIEPAIEAQYAAGATTLRSGLGAVYVRAAGNGFRNFRNTDCTDAIALGVSCQNPSMDGELSIFYDIVTSALSADGRKTSYSSAGSAVWVSAPGGEYGFNSSMRGGTLPPQYYAPAMVTTDRVGCAYGYARTAARDSDFDLGYSPNQACDYTNTFNGTSSATPANVGSIALLLDARPDLTWRDVKHVLAMTARKVDPTIAAVTTTLSDGTYTAELPWTRNAAGRWFHNWYGFGAVDVDAAVTFARTYTANSLGSFTDAGWLASATPLGLAIPDNSVAGAASRLTVARALTIEAVQIEVTITHPMPSDLGFELVSPSGMKSILLNIRNGYVGSTGWKMTLISNAFYGETSAGAWTLKVVDGRALNVGTLDQWKLRVLGH